MNRKHERGQDGKCNGKIHPLFIDHVAKKIFYFVLQQGQPSRNNYYEEKRHSRVVIDTLTNARLVCRLWYELATPLLKGGGPSLKFGCETRDIPWKPDAKMKCFLKTMKSSEIMPVERCTLNPLVFAEEHNQKLLETFIEVCAPSAVSLDLQFSPFRRPQLSGLEWTVLRLKKVVKFITSRRKKESVLEMTDKLLSSAKNLKELSISIPEWWEFSSGYDEAMEIETHLKAMFMIIPSTVKALRLDICSILRYQLIYLIELNLNLECLDFRVGEIMGGHDFLHIEIIRNLFAQQSLLLRRLTLFAGTFCAYWLSEAIEPLQFPNVVFLQLESRGNSFEELPLYRLFPNLLYLNLKNFKRFNDLNMELLSLEKESQLVEELFLPSDHIFPWEEVVRLMGRVFPNLKRLHFPLDNYYNKTFEDISVHFPNLQLLTCYDGTVEQTGDSLPDAN